MPKIITQIVDKSGFQLPTGKSMTQYTIETLQSFVCIIADRDTDELDWGFLKCITNVLDELICCTDNYERLAQEAIEDVDGKKIRLLLSFHNTRHGSLNFLDWDDAKVSETISNLISKSPFLSELKRIFDGETETDAGLKDFMPIPDNQKIVNIEDVAETFCEIRNGFLQAYPVMNPQPDNSNEQEQTVVALPPELDTPQAHIIWSKARHNKWIDDNYQFVGTRQQMCFAADVMGKSLKLKKNRWKPFETLWNYKYFAQTRQKGELGYEPIDRMNEIKKSFSL